MDAGSGGGESGAGSAADRVDGERKDLEYVAWKSNTPVLYDWLQHYNSDWPALGMCWGARVPDRCTSTMHVQQFYLSTRTTAACNERTGVWSGWPNVVHVAEVSVPAPHTRSHFGLNRFDETSRSRAIAIVKSLVHPGEVNRVRAAPSLPGWVATMTDSPHVFLWNTKEQPSREVKDGVQPSIPDLTLVGHGDIAEYAISISGASPRIIAGSSSGAVGVWDVRGSPSSPATSTPTSSASGSHRAAKRRRTGRSTSAASNELPSTSMFSVHSDTVEDLAWNPHDEAARVFVSGGDDNMVAVVDTRTSAGVTNKVCVHTSDVHAVDWSPLSPHLVLSGSNDATTKLLDVRQLGSTDARRCVVKTFQHNSSVDSVQWNPHLGNYFVTASSEGAIIWNTHLEGEYDYTRPAWMDRAYGRNVSKPPEEDAGATASGEHASSPPGSKRQQPRSGARAQRSKVFHHAGHRAPVADVVWNPCSASDEWMLASLSDDSLNPKLGGGTLQLWRVLDIAQDTFSTKDVEKLRTALEEWQKVQAAKDAKGAVG